ncbi:FAD:protein FMN transferase [Pirellulaceae bacterium SH449]
MVSFVFSILVVLFLSIQNLSHAQELAKELRRFEYSQPIMGTELKIILYAREETSVALAVNALLEELEEQAKPINNYAQTSEVSKLANMAIETDIVLSRQLGELLYESKRWYDLTDGVFDVTSGSILALWSQSRKKLRVPAQQELTTAKDRSGWKNIALTSGSNKYETLRFLSEGIVVNVSGIATGYLVDIAMKTLKEQGIESALIDIGGDIIVSEPPPGSEGWTIDIASLDSGDVVQKRITIRNQAVTTSGDLNQYTEIDGVRYSHLVDPVIGAPISRRCSVTVVAKRAIDADAGATAIAVLGWGRATNMLKDLPVDQVYIMERAFDESGNEPETKYYEWISDSHLER